MFLFCLMQLWLCKLINTESFFNIQIGESWNHFLVELRRSIKLEETAATKVQGLFKDLHTTYFSGLYAYKHMHSCQQYVFHLFLLPLEGLFWYTIFMLIAEYHNKARLICQYISVNVTSWRELMKTLRMPFKTTTTRMTKDFYSFSANWTK